MPSLTRRVIPAPLNVTSQDFPPHVQTNVAKLHQLGHYGKGMKVAILDSDVDCSHPALGGGFGPGFKIAGGWDLVGDEYNGHNEPKPDPDPCGICSVSVLIEFSSSSRQGFAHADTRCTFPSFL